MKRYTFIALFKAEHYKTKNNIAVLLFLLFPLVATVISYCMNIGNTAFATNPWVIIGKRLMLLHFFYPMLASIAAFSLCDIEYRNKNFRRLFTLPYSVHTLFASKILFLFEIVLFSTLIAYLSFMLGGLISSYVSPALTFQDYDIRLACFYLHLRLLTGLLAVSCIQFWLSLICRSFVIPIGFSGFMMLFSFISAFSISMQKYNPFNPYVSFLNSLNDFIGIQSVSFGKQEYVCLVYIFVFLLINLVTFKWRKYHN
jgi:hypothetical protein